MKEIIARATDEEVEEFKKIQTEAKAAEELSQRLMEDLQAVIYNAGSPPTKQGALGESRRKVWFRPNTNLDPRYKDWRDLSLR